VNAGGDVNIIDTINQIEAPRVSRAWIFSTLSALLILAGAGGALLYWWLLPMQGGYNLAVADLTYYDSNGQITANDETEQLSRWLFQVIDEEAHRLPAVLRPETRGPNRIRSIRAGDAGEREEAASRLARRLNATILIFGQVHQQADGSYLVQPEFNVSSDGFLYGSEAIGLNRLGSPIQVDGSLVANAQDLSTQLNGRLQALQRLVSGLGSYYLGLPEEAAAKFQQAIDVPQWEDGEGKEVAYFLLGQARLRSYDFLDDSTEALDQAYRAFNMAYGLNHDYARACLGLGAAALQRSGLRNSLQTGIGDVDPANLEEALYWYGNCGTMSDQSPEAYVQVKATFGLGQVNLLGGGGQIPGYSLQEANNDFKQVIEATRSNPNDDLKWYAAHSHAYTGWLAYITVGDLQALESECRQAIGLLEQLIPSKASQAYIARYWSWVAFAQEHRNDPQQARESYKLAIKLGNDVVNQAEIDGWIESARKLK
jgi:tetratricopeptide (TPR) repeat protein